MTKSRVLILSLVALGCLGVVSAPQAATPGTNGAVVYSSLPYVAHANNGGHFYRKAPTYYGSASIHSIAADGSGDHVLTAASVNAFDPAISPNGTRLAYVTHDGDGAATNGLWVADAQGAGAIQIWKSDRVGQPAWSPDGKRILESTRRAGIISIRADGTGTPRTLLAGAARLLFSDPTFTPNGAEILFSRFTSTKSGTNTGVSIWAMTASGGKVHRLIAPRTSLANAEQPDVSPGGTKITFVATDPALPGLWWIYLASINGSGVHRLASAYPHGYFVNHPSWSPDATQIVATLSHPISGTSAHGSSDLIVTPSTLRSSKPLPRPKVIKGSGTGLLLEPTWSAKPKS